MLSCTFSMFWTTVTSQTSSEKRRTNRHAVKPTVMFGSRAGFAKGSHTLPRFHSSVNPNQSALQRFFRPFWRWGDCRSIRRWWQVFTRCFWCWRIWTGTRCHLWTSTKLELEHPPPHPPQAQGEDPVLAGLMQQQLQLGQTLIDVMRRGNQPFRQVSRMVVCRRTFRLEDKCTTETRTVGHDRRERIVD